MKAVLKNHFGKGVREKEEEGKKQVKIEIQIIIIIIIKVPVPEKIIFWLEGVIKYIFLEMLLAVSSTTFPIMCVC